MNVNLPLSIPDFTLDEQCGVMKGPIEFINEKIRIDKLASKNILKYLDNTLNKFGDSVLKDKGFYKSTIGNGEESWDFMLSITAEVPVYVYLDLIEKVFNGDASRIKTITMPPRDEDIESTVERFDDKGSENNISSLKKNINVNDIFNSSIDTAFSGYRTFSFSAMNKSISQRFRDPLFRKELDGLIAYTGNHMSEEELLDHPYFVSVVGQCAANYINSIDPSNPVGAKLIGDVNEFMNRFNTLVEIEYNIHMDGEAKSILPMAIPLYTTFDISFKEIENFIRSFICNRIPNNLQGLVWGFIFLLVQIFDDFDEESVQYLIGCGTCDLINNDLFCNGMDFIEVLEIITEYRNCLNMKYEEKGEV